MLQLPNNCYSSNPSIYPTDWKTGGTRLLKKNWYVQYWFHDPLNRDRYPRGKLSIVKGGVNHYKTLAERRHVIAKLLEDEIATLKAGYNPITGVLPESLVPPMDYEVDPNTPMVEALNLAQSKVDVAKSTAKDIRSVLRYVIPAAERLRLDKIPISSVRRRHIRMILDEIAKSKGEMSPTSYNWYRANLSILFKQLLEMEAIETNPVREIAKKKGVQRLRQVLTIEERVKIDRHLRKNRYHFWLFINIFFHSGARLTEIIRIKGKDVDLKNQRVKYIVKKGKVIREVYRTIKDIALPFWEQALVNCAPDHYVFSVGYKPSEQLLACDRPTKSWLKWVKRPLGIEADLYSLKHANTDEIAAMMGLEVAAKHNAHTVDVAKKHYAVNENARIHEKLKRLGNSFSREELNS